MKILYVINSPSWTEISPTGLNNQELLAVNPELKNANIPYHKGEYTLNVPASKVNAFYENVTEIKNSSKIINEIEASKPEPEVKEIYYTVRRGDCLPIIARKYGCSVSQLKAWNKLKSSTIYPNQKLKIIKS